jgi:hypothetical protein
MNRLSVLACAALIFASIPSGWARTAMREVDVVVDMTPEGRKLEHPSPAKPAYYFPIIGGYKEMGALVAGEKPPAQAAVVHIVAVELAKAGYFTCLHPVPATAQKPAHMAFGHQPAILILIHWGYMNPQIDDFDPAGSDPSSKVFFNQNQMLALVGGNTLGRLDLNFEREEVMQAAQEDRYFITVSAYDAPAYFEKKKKVALWQAKMSVPSNGVDFSDVMTALVKAGGPLLGRETVRPKMLMAPLTPEGHVEVGTPTVKDYLDAPAPTSAATAPLPPTDTTPVHTPR